jgi:hypothetical protein
MVKPKDRIKAMQFLQGPQPGRAGVQVTVNNNQGVAGYVIDLSGKREIGAAIDHAAEVVPALPSSQNNAGNQVRDRDNERRERKIRP